MATVNERLRLAHRDLTLWRERKQEEEGHTVRQLRQALDKYLKMEVSDGD